MARYVIGDLQGCLEPLQRLLHLLKFKSDRDQLFFAGDLVNRGPQSLEVLRLLRSLHSNAATVLGNHDLHLLAHHFDPQRPLRKGDTLQAILNAPDREALIEWLLQQPLALQPAQSDALIVHAGIVPQWDAAQTLALAHQTSLALQQRPAAMLGAMYGNEPDLWNEDLSGADRHRFVINALTRLRFCLPDGKINLKLKCAPAEAPTPWQPWFEHTHRRSAATRVIFGHWSALGFMRRPRLIALDTGCVWGGQLTAIDLDNDAQPAWQVSC